MLRAFSVAIAVVTAIACVAAPPAHAECPNGDCPTTRTYVVYGARLGGFPKFLSTGYDPIEDQHLNGTYPIYVEYVKTNADASCFPGTVSMFSDHRRFTTPQLLSSQDAFMGHASDFKVVANGIGSESGYGDNFADVGDYVPCAPNQGLDAPQLNSFPLDASANLHVEDFTFGGVGRKTTIILERKVLSEDCGQEPSTLPWYYVAVVIGWEAPGCRLHDWPPPSDRSWMVTPDSTLVQTVDVEWGNLGQTMPAHCPRHVVSWCSADFAPASPGFVTASDVAAFSPHLTEEPDFWWGMCTPINEGNWKFNIGGQGNPGEQSIDAADCAALAASLGEQCGMSKSGTEREEERNAIMAWFGFERTGEMVSITPTALAPEWALVDPVKNRLAILDPYGYQRHLAASRAAPVNWTQAKSLYR